MRNIKKSLSIILLVIVSVSLIAGCNRKASTSPGISSIILSDSLVSTGNVSGISQNQSGGSSTSATSGTSGKTSQASSGNRSQISNPGSSSSIMPTTKPTAFVTAPAGSVPAVIWQVKELTFTSSFANKPIINSGEISTFESDSVPPGWTAPYGGSISISNDVAHTGTRSLKMINRTEAWFSPALNIYSSLKKGGAGSYVISFWVYAETLPDGYSQGRLLLRGESADINSFIKKEGLNHYAVVSTLFTTSQKTWIKYSGTVDVLDSDITRANGKFDLCLDNLAGESGQNVYIDDLSIQKAHYVSSFENVQMDATFQGPGNKTLKIPAFWDGGNTWKVRFTPTDTGVWTYQTSCSDSSNSGLNNKTGTIFAREYTGSLDIYKRGFITISSNKRYFTYADGTPFFYMGDTHRSMLSEPFDTSSISSIPSQFKYIIDKRVEQGFTVYQSEPAGANYDLSNGLQDNDIAGFQDLDRRFAYIAEKGLVHANAELFPAAELTYNKSKYSSDYLKLLCRYWIARYGAYPVLWTTAQEVDNDLYYNMPNGGQTVFNAASNPWKGIAAWIASADPYKHPLTAHMEYASTTDPDGTVASTSSFKGIAGHNWFAAKWTPGKSNQIDFRVPKDFWNSNKLTVNYEGAYDFLWTKEFGSRAQGWIAFLNGMSGYGYGAIDIWYYNSDFDMETDSIRDGDVITVADKQTKWNISVDFQTAIHLGYMKSFFNNIAWWNMTPRFDDTGWFVSNGGFYSLATISNNTYIAYFYNKTISTGTLKGMSDVPYVLRWFNPRTNIYASESTLTPVGGNLQIGNKPDEQDWVLLAKKK